MTQRHCATLSPRPRAWLLSLLAALVLAAPLAAAQEGADAGDELDVSEETFEDWRVRCEQPAEGPGEERCFMFQNLVMKDSQRQLLNFAIAFPDPEAEDPTAVIMVPLGVSLPAGLALTASEGQEPLKVPYQHCIAMGCRAVMPLEGAQVAAMKAGREAQVGFADGTGRTVQVPVSLSGFTAAFNTLEAKR